MANIFNMLARVDSLEESREWKRKNAAEMLQKEVCAFVAHYGYACTEECPCTLLTYTILRDGLILRKKEEDDPGEVFQVGDLSIAEMEFIHEFMVDTLHHDSQYIEDELQRYINLCQ